MDNYNEAKVYLINYIYYRELVCTKLDIYINKLTNKVSYMRSMEDNVLYRIHR